MSSESRGRGAGPTRCATRVGWRWRNPRRLTEIYESKTGIQEHWAQSQKSWGDFAAMVQVISSCNPQTLHSGMIAQSLW